jgi:hypothetical protein
LHLERHTGARQFVASRTVDDGLAARWKLELGIEIRLVATTLAFSSLGK